MPDSLNMAAALRYLRRGFSVIPLCWPTVDGQCGCGLGHKGRDIGKAPRIRWRPYTEHLPDANEVRAWWAKWPNANVGIVTGQVSGLLVLDIDAPSLGGHTEDGMASIERAGLNLPETPTVLSPSGGRHYYYAYPSDLPLGTRLQNFAGEFPGIDGRGDGGQVAAPPSLHLIRERYRGMPGHSLDDLALAPAPQWLVDIALRHQGRVQPSTKERGVTSAPSQPSGPSDGDMWFAELMRGAAPPGAWHDSVVSAAGYLRAHGIALEAATNILVMWNRYPRANPHPDEEIAQQVADIYTRYQHTGRRNLTEGIDPASEASAMGWVTRLAKGTVRLLTAEEIDSRIAGAVHSLEEGAPPQVVLALLAASADGDMSTARTVLGPALHIYQRNQQQTTTA